MEQRSMVGMTSDFGDLPSAQTRRPHNPASGVRPVAGKLPVAVGLERPVMEWARVGMSFEGDRVGEMGDLKGQHLKELRAVRRWAGIASLEKQAALSP